MGSANDYYQQQPQQGYQQQAYQQQPQPQNQGGGGGGKRGAGRGFIGNFFNSIVFGAGASIGNMIVRSICN